MDLADLSARVEKMDTVFRKAVDQLQHTQRLHLETVKRETLAEFQGLHDELSTLSARAAARTELHGVADSIDKVALECSKALSVGQEANARVGQLAQGITELRGELARLQAVGASGVAGRQAPDYDPVEQRRRREEGNAGHATAGYDGGKPSAVRAPDGGEWDKALALISEKLAEFEAGQREMKETLNHELDEVRMAIFTTIEGLRRQIPLARDYSGPIEQTRARVMALEKKLAATGSASGSAPEGNGASGTIDMLATRLEALERVVASAEGKEVNTGLIDGLAARVFALEKAAGVDGAQEKAVLRRLEALEAGQKADQLKVRLDLLEKMLSER